MQIFFLNSYSVFNRINDESDMLNSSVLFAAEEVEEVFAEDYDDPTKPPEAPAHPEIEQATEENNNARSDVDEPEQQYVNEIPACPNRVNPYHTCVKYCRNRWGLKKFNPDSDMQRKRERMLRKYPLPEGWKEVADPET
jgi:polyglutamine-binding protein 1